MLASNIKEILGIIATCITIALFIANALVVIIWKIKKSKGDKKAIIEAFNELPSLINKAELIFKNQPKSGAAKLEYVISGFYALSNNLSKLVKKEQIVDKVEEILTTPAKKSF